MKKPTLVILGGFAGAGKTTMAKKVSANFNLPLVNTDEINDSLREIFNLDFKTASPRAHDIAWRLVKKYLENGVTVILDTNMCNDRTWNNVDALKESMPNIEILPLILECSLETHKKRIEHRGETNKEHLNLGGDTFEDTLHKYEYIKTLNRTDLIRINAEGNLDDVYNTITDHLQEARGC